MTCCSSVHHGAGATACARTSGDKSPFQPAGLCPGSKGAAVGSSTCGPAVSWAQRGTFGGAHHCCEFLEGLGKMLMVASVAL